MVYTKVELYVNHDVKIDHKCTESVIRELYETRANCDTHILSISVMQCAFNVMPSD